ncbi:protein slit-like [Leptopilina boulardi]|uniref:protein slit-like n=1 Tax=Leptopilina boulardi TaxID=63433 RepID=UPI0021F539DE|nr:protein slit-like [Leptopilina boulardi]
MWYFLTSFIFLLIAKDITSNRCPTVFHSTPHCFCEGLFSPDKINIYCAKPIIETNTDEIKFFHLKFFDNEVKLNCSHSPDWSKFNYNFQKYAQERKVFTLKHCTFEQNTNLSKFAKMINAINVEEIHLTDNTIQLNTIGFNKNLFQGFDEIKILRITNNLNLTTINSDLFEFLPHLVNLHLVNNNLKRIPENLFGYLPNLNILRLSRNNIQSLSSNSFQNLTALTYLDLSYNKINDLQPNIFDAMINLKILLLDNNNFTWLPEYAFKKLTNLKYLDLTSTGLISLLETVFRNNKKLTSLNLKNNQLKTLPSKIFHELINLETLNICNNQMEQIPQDIFSKLVNLTSLNLSGNQFKFFGDFTFQNLINLQNLNLRHNQLDNLADSRFERRQMQDFLITSELFQRSDWKNNYPLVSIIFNCFNLIHLDLAYNNIQKIHDDWFLLSKLKLQSLNLTHNRISELNFDQGLIQKEVFYIDLSHNEIVGIVPTNFSDIKIVSLVPITVIINDNPINCDCKTIDLLRYMNFEIKHLVVSILNIVSENLKCQRPEKLKGRLFSSLRSSELSCELSLNQCYNSCCNKKCNVNVQFEKRICNDETNVKMKQIHKFNCTNRYLKTLPKDMCIFPETYVELDLTNNELKEIPVFDNEDYYDTVTKLILSNNLINNFRGISSYKNLEILEINNNQQIAWDITENEINEISKMKHLQQISLHRSLFVCNSNINNLINYRMFTLISNVRQLSCVQPVTKELIYPFETLILSR